MKTFLLNKATGTPVLKWGNLPDGVFFEGDVPKGFKLAVCPNAPYIILDVDNKNGKRGMDNIPLSILQELNHSLTYTTKSGFHYWIKYTGEKKLMNRATKYGLDLRTHKGYVAWYLDGDIRNYQHHIKESSPQLNEWLESLFA